MRKPIVATVLMFAVFAGAVPVTASSASSASRAAAASMPVTSIAVNGNGGDRTYDGVGAILGGGGNARYLMDYPAAERSQILRYLFQPGYGASLQLLKLEIGGGANSSDGAEPSIEPVQGNVNCNAGYEFSIAQQAVALNPFLRLYGLQWSAPGWVSDGTGTAFSSKDISYLLDWLNCARQHGLTISYLGGQNESDNGSHAAWWHSLRVALDQNGYSGVQLVAGDSVWRYVSNPPDPDIAILGAHDVCGYPTGDAGPDTTCSAPQTAIDSGKPLWASELGAMDAGAQRGCVIPCAPAMDRATVRGYHDARLTGYLEWPAIDAMPPGLPFENRGLVTADQPWSGSYQVNAMTWAIAHFTQFVWPPNPGNPGGWKYLDSATGLLQGNRADGSYDTFVRSGGTDWSTVIETTTATAAQQASFTVTGGVSGLAGHTVHVWASDFDFATDSPATWFVQQPDIHPVNGTFTITLQPGWVYSLTTTTGQGKGTAAGPAPSNFPLPYTDTLATPGQAGPVGDDEPQYLAAQDGSFELAPCQVPDGSNTTCTEQTTVPTPVFWKNGSGTPAHYPYATVGDASMSDYAVSVDTLLTQAGTSSGVIGRFSDRASQGDAGHFDGYVFDVSASGAWQLIKNNNNPAAVVTLASGTLQKTPGTGTWHRLSLSMSGDTIAASVDGTQVASVTDSTPWTTGPAGIEAGAFTSTWPKAQYSNLSVTP
jgi:Glycosyl hydrolase family 59